MEMNLKDQNIKNKGIERLKINLNADCKNIEWDSNVDEGYLLNEDTDIEKFKLVLDIIPLFFNSETYMLSLDLMSNYINKYCKVQMDSVCVDDYKTYVLLSYCIEDLSYTILFDTAPYLSIDIIIRQCFPKVNFEFLDNVHVFYSFNNYFTEEEKNKIKNLLNSLSQKIKLLENEITT